MKPKDIARFASKVLPLPSSGCWIWLDYILKTGYGRFRYGGRKWLAHRFSYLLFKGEIGEGLQLDHLCRVRYCVNPLHLEAVTAKANVGRGKNKPRIKCPRGHLYNKENTYIDPQGKRNCILCRRILQRGPRAKKEAK